MLSVIIPALNEEIYISKCIEGLINLELNNTDIEIILVDNGSKDNTVDIAAKYGIKILIKEHVNISALRNWGALNSKGDILAFIDADCVVSKDWFINAMKCMTCQSADAVGSFHVIPDNASWIGKTAALIQNKKIGANVSYIPSGNFLIKKSVFEAVCGFDESLETNEDVELCHRLKRNGYRLFLDPKIKCIHLGYPKNIKEMFTRELWHGKNSWTVFIQDLLKVRNLKVISYSALNCVLLFAIVYGGYQCLFFAKNKVFILSISSYFVLNAFIAFLDWQKIKVNYFPIFFYVLIYGTARALSVIKWSFAHVCQLKKDSKSNG